MKLTPFLFEVSAEALTKFYKEKFYKLLNWNMYPGESTRLAKNLMAYVTDTKINEHTFDLFIKFLFDNVDPTKGKDYTRWLVERWFADEFDLEDANKVREYLELFHVHKKNLPIKDIGRIKSSGELFKILKDAGVIGVSVSGINPAELQALVQSKDIKFMGDLPKWLIYVPITVKGSCYLGKETEWCTAKYKEDDERNMFNYYNQDGELWVFLNKTSSSGEPTKIQIHFDSGQIMDQDDKDIDKDTLKETYPEIPEFLIKTVKNLVKSNKDLNIGLFPEYWDDEIKLKILRRELHYYGENLVIDNFELNQEIWNSVDEHLLDGVRLSFTDCIFKQIDFGNKVPKRIYNSKLAACKLGVYRTINLADCVVFNCEFLGFKEENAPSNIICQSSEFIDTRFTECHLTTLNGESKLYQCTLTNKFSLGNMSGFRFEKCNFADALGNFYKCGFVQCNFSQQMFKQASYTASEIAETFEKCKLDDYTKQQIPFSEVLKENKIKPSLATLLFEMPMKTVPEVHKENIAMLVHKKHGGNYLALILYKITDNKPVVIGRISSFLNNQCKAFEVAQSAAEQNYGPLLYDMLMSMTNSYVIPDTSGVSKDAKGVWDKMISMPGKYQVEDTPNCGKRIKILQPVSGYKQLINNHVDNIDFLRKLYPAGYEDRLIELSREYFIARHKGSEPVENY